MDKMQLNHSCKICNTSFSTKSRISKYCSPSCETVGRTKKIKKICKCCGSEFLTPAKKENIRPAFYCSQPCYWKSKVTPAETRFWNHVKKLSKAECWHWNGIKVNRHSHIEINGAHIGTHCFSYEIANGKIPDGFQINHKCNNPSCVNPDHLYVGTQRDNMHDRNNRKSEAFFYPRAKNIGAKLTEQCVTYIRTVGGSSKDLSIKFGVHEDTIDAVKKNKTWVD